MEKYITVSELSSILKALPLMDSRPSLNTCVDVSEVELPVEIQEDGVITHIGSDVLRLWPG